LTITSGRDNRELVALAPHRFDEDRQVQLATTRDPEFLGFLGLLDAQGDVVLGLAQEAIADLARGQEAAAAHVLLARERGVVHLEGHADGGLVDAQHRQLLGRVGRAQGLGDAQALDPGDADDVAGVRDRHLGTFEAHETQHLQNPTLALVAIAVDHRDGGVGLHRAALDAAHADDADVGVVVQARDAHLERTVGVDLRRVHVLDDGFEQRGHVAIADVRGHAGVAIEGRGVDGGEIELLLGGAQAVEQVEGLVHHPVRTRARAIDLVDHDDGLEAHLERLLGDEAGLRHRAVQRVHEQQHRVDHGQNALDFAAEVGVAGRVHDVDAVVLPGDGGVLREDRDATFLLEIVRVHDPVGHDRALVERPRLLQQLVDQSGLAVVHVGHDGDVAQVFDGHDEIAPGGWTARGSRPF
jgi:hypothetical protein